MVSDCMKQSPVGLSCSSCLSEPSHVICLVHCCSDTSYPVPCYCIIISRHPALQPGLPRGWISVSYRLPSAPFSTTLARRYVQTTSWCTAFFSIMSLLLWISSWKYPFKSIQWPIRNDHFIVSCVCVCVYRCVGVCVCRGVCVCVCVCFMSCYAYMSILVQAMCLCSGI